MSAILDFNQKLQTSTCCTCGIVWAMPTYFLQQRQEDGNWFYCPNGHPQHFSESEVDRLKKQLEQEKRNTEWWKNSAASKDSQIKGANIQLGKVKAKLHRTERRIANGVCPCCKRSFQNVMRHMKSKHPDYVEGNSPNEEIVCLVRGEDTTPMNWTTVNDEDESTGRRLSGRSDR